MRSLLKFPQIAVLMALFGFLSLAAIVFTPAFPMLSREFGLTAYDEQWIMTLFLFGTAVGRLPYAPLANRIGRKNTLFIGLGISMIGTLMILFTPSYAFLCFGRFIQAFGCAVALKIGYTMVGDVYSGPKAAKVLGYAMLAYAILPGVGTAIAGFLIESMGWKGGFWFFLLFTIALGLSCFLLPETGRARDPHALRIGNIAKGYATQFKDPSILCWSALMGLSTAILFIFAQEAPFLAIEQFSLTPEGYGIFYMIPAFGIAVGSLMTVWLADRLSAIYSMMMGIAIILFGSLLMGALFLGGWISGWALFLPQVFIQLGDALLYNYASSSAVSQAKDKSNASAILLFINSLIAVMGTFIVGAFIPRTLLAMPIIFVSIVILMVIIWLLLRNKSLK